MSEDLLSPAEAAEIAHLHARFTEHHACGSVSVQLNYNDGKLSTVVVNGRRFERRSLSAAPK